MPADADLHAAAAWRDRLAGRTGWRLLGALIERVQDAEFQRDVLLLAIRRHRDAQGEARTLADAALYAWLPPGARDRPVQGYTVVAGLYDGLVELIHQWQHMADAPVALRGEAQALRQCAQELQALLEAYTVKDQDL